MIPKKQVTETIKNRFDLDNDSAEILTDIIFDNLNEDNKEVVETEEGFNELLEILDKLLKGV